MSAAFKRTLFLVFVLSIFVANAREAGFTRQNNLRGHKFFDNREYDDGFAEYTGAEKKRMSDLQQRLLEEQEQELEDERFIQILRQQNKLDSGRKEEYQDAEADKGFYDVFQTEGDAQDTEVASDTRGLSPDDLALKREEEMMKQENMKATKDIPGVGELFEEDIVMDARLRGWVAGDKNKRDAVIIEDVKWPGGVVPYVFTDDIPSGTLKRDIMEEAIRDFHDYTCIRLREKRASDVDYIRFISNKSQCYSNVGRTGGAQNVSIGDGCERKGTSLHEIMHVLGFIHEQSRPDRNKYIKVLEENIKPAMIHNFDRYPGYMVSDLDVGYDFDSVLHYNNKAFSKNGEDTIESLEDNQRQFGQRVMFSKRDVEQINNFYNCPVNDALQDKIDQLKYD